MKHFIRIAWVLASVLLLCLTSCLNEAVDPNSGEDQLPSNVATLSEQVASMKSSVADIELVQAALSEADGLQGFAAQFEACATSVKEHIANVESGLSGVTAVMTTMKIQAQVAHVIGALKAQSSFVMDILSLEKGVAAWLGKDFKNYFALLVEQARLETILGVVESQALSVDALVSDVEAGLRVGDTSGLDALLETVTNNVAALTSLVQKISSLATEVEKGYASAIKSETSYLKELNTKAAAAVSESEVTLADLVARVEKCEQDLQSLNSRLEKVEADVEALLGMIQSVTFLSDYSEDYAIAYYEMNNNKVSAPGKAYDGKNQRDAAGTISLSYMVRPASAAAAVTSDVVSVVGYYANQIQTKAVDPSQFVNFEVKSVQLVNPESGIVTVTLSHDLKADFYYKAVGAKCALFIATGKTDISSKFVELVPKDNSSTVYVEGIKINTDDFEIDEGQTKNLTATVNPSSATIKTVKWTSLNTEIATIDQYSGVLTAVKQGNVTITATTNGINEWGDNLTASVNVKVNPSIRLGGPFDVEVGKTAELSLDYPAAMKIESKVWLSSDETKATVENGVVTGVADSYNVYKYEYVPVTITCIVNGNITLTHEMDIIVPQPKQIRFNNYADDVDSISMKVDETISLAATILPENVDQSKLRIQYQSDGGLGWVNYDTGEIKNPGTPGARYVYVDVFNKGDDNYFVSSLRRTVIINVEPYYVKTMAFAQERMTMAPDQTSVLAPVFTSDVVGKQPTYTALNWVSSNPSVVSVDSTTGEITTHKEGSAVITATTANANAVPSGQTAISASCTIVVEAPVAIINIGDYFYSDGTWSSERDYSKTVIGIVFSNAGAATSDPILMKDCPKATHGLVVGLTEYNSTLGQFGYSSVYTWLTGAGYPAISVDVPNGYGLTKGMTAYRDANSSYVELYDRTSGPVAKHKVSLPTGVSSWYIPSFKEMKWLHENKAVVNAALSNAGGTQITGSLYWLSTLRTYNSYNDCQGSPFDMVNGAWYSYDKKTTSYPVRVIFAF